MHFIKVSFWSLLLIGIGLTIILYKYFVIEIPLLPNQNTKVWLIQSQVDFMGVGRPAKVSLESPKITPGFIILDEDFISNRYGFSISESKEQRILDWAVRRARGEQRLYYRVTVAKSDLPQTWKSVPPFPVKPVYPEPYKSAVEAIINQVRVASADIASFTQELLVQVNDPNPNENVELIKDRAANDRQWIQEVILLLQSVRIPARTLWGLSTAKMSNNVELTPLLQVHNGNRWFTFNPKTGEKGIPKDFLVWKIGDPPIAILEGGKNLQVTFSITESYTELIDVARKNADYMDSPFEKLSTSSLPIQHQNIYQLLLMVPLGALLVVFIRVFIGLPTFGTFMPILIALAFRETQLAWGIILFTLIVSFGLFIRFYLEHLMLLLIPRLAAILVIVIMIMLCISLTTNELGTERLLSVSLFPMVIIAMTIERMSIHWEENGVLSALGHGLGSLIVAVLGYHIMTNENLIFFMFVFPETMLVILGLCLLSGRYTGYRLTELFRFSDLNDKTYHPDTSDSKTSNN